MYELVTACEELLDWDMARTMDLVSGTSYKSTEPARALHQLAEMAQSRPAVRKLLDQADELTVELLGSVDEDFAGAFDSYLHVYASRALGYTIAEPTLAELPALVLGMVRGQIERGYDPEEERAASARKRAMAAAEARTMLAGRPGAQERFDHLMARAERAYPVREDNEFYTMSTPFALMRYAVLEIGRRLAERGIISSTDDVMFLELDVARSSLFAEVDHKKLIERRKGERAWAELNPGPPYYGVPQPPPSSLDFLPADARLPMESMLWSFEAIMAIGESSQERAASESKLRGIGASAGRYTGRVRVIMDESQFDRLQPGDVLVCPITSPVWSVLFPTIGALVTDTGGVLSHPAIIAREYQLPAVVATGNATSMLEDGQSVTVDGLAGTVEIDP